MLRFRVLGASFLRFWVLRFRSRVLRFRDLGASFSSFGCFVFEFWVLRDSVFVFECFVFETTLHEELDFAFRLSNEKIFLFLQDFAT